MKIIAFSLSLITLVAVSCNVDKEKKTLRSKISELEAFTYSDTTRQLNRDKAMELMQAYTDFADSYPDDSLTAEYLFKGGEIAMNISMPGPAIEYFQRILNRNPKFDKVPYCLFLQAFIYENQLGQLETAKSLYQQFLDLYPDHEMAKDARASIDNMGKSLEELIKEWESKNQE